jgi:predicted metal-dependent HD superfamily phosphohydrolase
MPPAPTTPTRSGWRPGTTTRSTTRSAVDNEEASALLAESTLPGLNVPPDRVAEVARLVRLTASHDPIPGDRNGGLLTDADLCVLASPPDIYQAYTAAVRREYSFVPEQAFMAGRASVLDGLLALPRLFHTPALRERWEDMARSNLTRNSPASATSPSPTPPSRSEILDHERTA